MRITPVSSVESTSLPFAMGACAPSTPAVLTIGEPEMPNGVGVPCHGVCKIDIVTQLTMGIHTFRAL